MDELATDRLIAFQEYSQADVEQALGAAKVAWPRMAERAELAYRALAAEHRELRLALERIAEMEVAEGHGGYGFAQVRQIAREALA